MKRKILYITGSRADYGLMQSVLEEINNDPYLELEIVVTGMHLMKEFGSTLNEIKKDRFKIQEIDVTFSDDDKFSMSFFIGKLIMELTERIKVIKPDIILLLGDRSEMLAGAILGTYLSIPIAHIHGGDITSTVDEHARHAITKLAHIHFPATENSARRIIRMGEDPWRVHIAGSPAIDSISKENLIEPKGIAKNYDLDLSKPILIVVQHPVTMKFKDSASQILETLNAISELKYQTILIYPNADAGGRNIIKLLKKFEEKPFIQMFKSLPRNDYLSLMNIATIMIGNSSSGIVEAPYFNLPVVNIGDRQRKRERGNNVIDVDYDKYEISSAIEFILNKKIRKYESPYGTRETGKKISEILKSIKINEKLLQKKIAY